MCPYIQAGLRNSTFGRSEYISPVERHMGDSTSNICKSVIFLRIDSINPRFLRTAREQLIETVHLYGRMTSTA
jgi:hypothetical protein